MHICTRVYQWQFSINQLQSRTLSYDADSRHVIFCYEGNMFLHHLLLDCCNCRFINIEERNIAKLEKIHLKEIYYQVRAVGQ